MLTASKQMPRKPKRNDLAVKIDADVVKLARIVAAYDDVPMAELMSEALRPYLLKRLEKLKHQLPGPKDAD